MIDLLKDQIAGAPDLKSRACAALFEQVPLGVALIDLEKNILEANEAFSRIFGAPAGRKCYTVYKQQSQPCERCAIDLVFAEKVSGPSVFEEEGHDQHGSAITYQVQAVPIRGERGEVAFVLAISADITRRLQLRQELQQTERLASVGLTVASLAHTIKNILTGLEGGSYIVSSGLAREDLERVKGGWGMVQRYVDQVSSLVRNLLSYSKSREPERRPVDPRPLLEGIVSFFGDEARRSGIRLELRLAPDLTSPYLDPDLMHACLANLVANALDACTWDPDLEKVHQIIVSATPRPGGGVIFEVTDNGMGITEEDRPKIMQSLFTTKGIRGTGLGLLLTRKAVQEHGGTISFESTLGAGTTFRIELPMHGTGRRDSGEAA